MRVAHPAGAGCREVRKMGLTTRAKIRWLLPWLCCGLALGGISPGRAQEAPKPKETVAVVDGQPITAQELEAAAEGQLAQLRHEEFEVKRKTLEYLIDKKLLEAAASKQGVSLQELWKGIGSKVPEPTDAEVEARYQREKDQLKQPLDAVKEKLRSHMKQVRIDQARRDYVQRLRDASHVAIYLEQPKATVGYDPQRVRGNPKAPVMIVEFADFQCPFCRREQAVLKALLAKYGDKVSLAYRDFPLRPIHARAESAAEAARCAGAQGKFWEYHDLLYAGPAKLDATSLMNFAAQAGLDKKEFSACLSAGKSRTAIDEDLSAGERLGVSGTPTFFINGVSLSGAVPIGEFETIIDTELAAKNQKHAGPKAGAVVPSR